MNAATLAATDLACVRGERALFDGLSFTLRPGAGLALTGPNGVGKTSLLRILAGLVRPARGAVRLTQGAAERVPADALHFIGVRDGLRDALTPAETVRFWRDLHGGAAGEADALGAAGLMRQADLPCGALSAGQRRRLALSLLAVAPRPIWLLDEPLNALDAAAAAAFLDSLGAFLAGGGVAVVATHLPMPLPGMGELAFRADGGFTVRAPAS